MKAIVCGKCYDIRALREGASVRCSCGNVEGWWVSPTEGVAKVHAKERDRAKIVGFHNGLLAFAFKQHDFSPAGWRENHEILTSDEFAKGYVFHKDVRNCPVAIVPVGGTNDVSWSDTPFDATATTPIERLEDALEDSLDLTTRLKGKPEEAISCGISIRVEEALRALGWRA